MICYNSLITINNLPAYLAPLVERVVTQLSEQGGGAMKKGGGPLGVVMVDTKEDVHRIAKVKSSG